jgi:hypothetical protein
MVDFRRILYRLCGVVQLFNCELPQLRDHVLARFRRLLFPGPFLYLRVRIQFPSTPHLAVTPHKSHFVCKDLFVLPALSSTPPFHTASNRSTCHSRDLYTFEVAQFGQYTHDDCPS